MLSTLSIKVRVLDPNQEVHYFEFYEPVTENEAVAKKTQANRVLWKVLQYTP